MRFTSKQTWTGLSYWPISNLVHGTKTYSNEALWRSRSWINNDNQGNTLYSSANWIILRPRMLPQLRKLIIFGVQIIYLFRFLLTTYAERSSSDDQTQKILVLEISSLVSPRKTLHLYAFCLSFHPTWMHGGCLFRVKLAKDSSLPTIL